MAQSISQRELRNDSARILRAVDEGQSFVVTRHERPVAEVVPLHRARVVDLSIVERNFAGSPSIDSDAFMQDIDGAVIQDAEPRA
ncbi:type II toxin-antitoxin system Phd/YefM family antitoxin [uncultured Tessaracoccus sp.]|uniref:type II toxin-antitoxin system Phd/YefM family antitoxin n=1 Tax=uncultured Tessaracoccus sp. TaxID=905023 RepID=UPI0026171095|nr:type II toxin-antitoxin system prevent-host-death family antitoxin [uncultured Tessaracoccus sp.]